MTGTKRIALLAGAATVLTAAALAATGCSQASTSQAPAQQAAVAAAAAPAQHAATPAQVAAPVQQPAAAASTAKPKAKPASNTQSTAKTLITQNCTGCHSSGELLNYRAGSSAQAQRTASGMGSRAGLSAAQVNVLATYFAR